MMVQLVYQIPTLMGVYKLFDLYDSFFFFFSLNVFRASLVILILLNQ